MSNVHCNCFFVMSICCIGVPCRVSLSLGKALYKLNILLFTVILKQPNGVAKHNAEPSASNFTGLIAFIK